MSVEPQLAALAIAHPALDIPAVDRFYHALVVAQRMSNDLVIYSRDIGRIVTIAYPVGPRGDRIVSKGVYDWLDRRGLVLECFCAMVSGQIVAARFVNNLVLGHTTVCCHHPESRCGFFLDLDVVRDMTLLEASYYRLPTAYNGEPDIVQIVQSWTAQVARDPSVLQMQAPYFANYFGIHKSLYLDIHQLRGRAVSITSLRRRQSSTLKNLSITTN